MIAPWMLLLSGAVLVWLGLKNKATDFVNALLNNASPYQGTNAASATTPSGGDNKGAPADTGTGTVVT